MEPQEFSTPNPLDPFLLLACLMAFLMAVFWVVRGVWRRLFGHRLASPKLRASVLDTVLMLWQPGDALTLRDLLNGGIVIMGRPGSGKSSSSSQVIVQACVKFQWSGGLILSASPSDRTMVKHIFSRCPDRLVIFDERSPYRFNVVNYILACGGSTKDIVTAIYAISETVGRTSQSGGQGGEDGSFFTSGGRRIIENAVVVVKHATGTVSPASLIPFINSSASSLAEVHSDAFQETFHYKCLKDAYDKEKSPVETFDYEQARAFFTQELPRMAERTRSSLIAVVMNLLHIFNSGQNRLLFAGESNISPKLMDESKWIFVDMPISRCGQEGAFALGVWKFITQWHVLRRDSSRANPPLIIHADEFHTSINSYDTQFLGESRKFSGCMIACTQSKASFYANMGGESSEAQVDALLNNFSHKIFHALGDIRTAEWASQLAGTALQFNIGGSQQQVPDQSPVNNWLGNTGWGGSFSENMRPLIEPRAFMHGLRTGGQRNDNICDAVLMRSGEPFSNGENFLWLAFQQPELR